MRYRLRTLLIWALLAVVWGTLALKAVSDAGPRPAYPHGRGPELALLGLVLAALTAAIAVWQVGSRRQNSK